MKQDELKAVLATLDLDEVARMADIGGQAPELAAALNRRYGTRIDLVSLRPRGRFADISEDEAAAYLEKLKALGVDEADVSVVTHRKMAGKYDVIASLNGFGSVHRIAGLERFLGRVLHAQSRLVIEVRKGSGSYPFLNRYGSCNTLIPPGREKPGLVVMSVEPASEPAGKWSAIARELAGEGGFFTDCGEHSFLFIPRGDTLVVTFDNLDIAMTKREERRPWGFGFIEAQGWSMLGVMAGGWTWFRDQAVTEEFNRLRDSGFFGRFRRVVFYGASMGGYAAAAFSPAAPGATVFAISPQSTLDKAVVPWEMRYKKAWSRDFSGEYGDAAEVSKAAAQVHVMYDPYVKPDAAHAARFTGENVTHWRCPLLGHRLGSSLHQMGILQEIARRIIDGTLDRHGFHRLLRRRHDFPRYQRELANLALERGHPELAAQVCRYSLDQRDDRHLGAMLDRLSKAEV